MGQSLTMMSHWDSILWPPIVVTLATPSPLVLIPGPVDQMVFGLDQLQSVKVTDSYSLLAIFFL